MKSQQKTSTILIVDDELGNLNLLSDLLTKQGFNIRASKTGREAIGSAKVEAPDIILLDIKLPDISGYEVCRLLKSDEKTNSVPVIFLSALNDTADKVLGFNAGGVDYISKPFNSDEVIVRVKNHLEISRLHADLSFSATELQKSLSLTEATLESFHNGILVISESGSVIKTNSKFRELWNIPDDLVNSGDDKKLLSFVINQLSDPDEFMNKVLELYHNPTAESFDLIYFKDGRVFERNSKPMYLNGIPKGRVWSFLNITSRKKAEKELLEMNESLEQRVVERTAELQAINRELESFSYSVSHDLRAPLRHISGYAEFLTNDFKNELPDKGQHYLNAISTSAKQMGILIDDLLNFSRTGRIELQKDSVDMNKILDEVILHYKTLYPDRDIKWKVSKFPEVYGDQNLLRTVWTNLVDNAVKYSRFKKKASIEVGCETDDNECRFFIRDNGVGFDMKYAGKLFGIFQRLHSSVQFEGTGIGLANVQRIVLRHNGRVWCTARPGKGATFSFSIPVYSA